MKTKILCGMVSLCLLLGLAPARAASPFNFPVWAMEYNMGAMLYNLAICQMASDPEAAVEKLKTAREFSKESLALGGSELAIQLDTLIARALQQAEAKLAALPPASRPKLTKPPLLPPTVHPRSNNSHSLVVQRS
jgi:hypothetical protein